MSFKVEGIDHAELQVPDRRQAADWYERHLGLQVIQEFEHWASSRRGPLMLSSDDGRTKLALFEGEPQGDRPIAGYRLVAFSVSGEGFLEFLGGLAAARLRDHTGSDVTDASWSDHGESFSVYFNDPWGNRLEVTSYDADFLRARLQG